MHQPKHLVRQPGMGLMIPGARLIISKAGERAKRVHEDLPIVSWVFHVRRTSAAGMGGLVLVSRVCRIEDWMDRIVSHGVGRRRLGRVPYGVF